MPQSPAIKTGRLLFLPRLPLALVKVTSNLHLAKPGSCPASDPFDRLWGNASPGFPPSSLIPYPPKAPDCNPPSLFRRLPPHTAKPELGSFPHTFRPQSLRAPLSWALASPFLSHLTPTARLAQRSYRLHLSTITHPGSDPSSHATAPTLCPGPIIGHPRSCNGH